MAIPLGAAMLGSAAITTFGGLLGGGGRSAEQQPPDNSALYLAAAPINQRLTYAGQEFISSLAPYLTAVQGKTQFDLSRAAEDYMNALSRSQQQAGLMTGGAAGYMQASIDKERLAGMGPSSLELEAGTKEAEMRSKGADVLGLQQTATAKSLQDLYGSSAATRNQMLAQQQLGNIQANKRAAEIQQTTLADLARRRDARAAALTPSFA